MQFPSPRLWLFDFLGQSVVVHVVTRLAFLFPCADCPASRRHQPSQPRHILSSAPLVCRSDMHAGQGPDLAGVDALPEQVLLSLLHTPNCYGPFGVSCWSNDLSFEGAASVRDVGLDANAGHRRICQDSRTRGSKSVARETPTSKVYRTGLKTQTPDR